MGIESGVEKASGRAVQSSLFMSNIGKMFADMDRMEAKTASRNAKMQRLASSYIDSGLTNDEAVELLVEDGFEVEMVRNYILSMSADIEDDDDGMWDFIYETVNGDIKRGSDIGNIIFASNRDEAFRKAQNSLDKSSVFEVNERVIDVERFNE